MPRLTKRTVEALLTQDRAFFIWDDAIAGFGVIVLPTGVKSYVYQYRSPEGRSRRTTIAKVGAMTCEQARKKAEALRRVVLDGGDPLRAKHEARQSLTVADVLDEYLRSARFAALAPSRQAIDKGRIERHLKPLLGAEHCHHLTVEAVRRAYGLIRDGHHKADVRTRARGRAIVKGGPAAARDCIVVLRIALNWAIEERLIPDHNPARNVKLPPHGSRDVFLTEPAHYERLFATLDRMETELRIRPAVADAIRVLALTGCRKSEIACARWRHVDIKAATLTLPPTAHKAGRATGKAKVIHLPAAAAEIVARQPTGQADDYVFRPAKGQGGEIELGHPWRRIRAEADLPEGIGLHGLRHSVGSYMALAGAEAPQIMAALGHRQVATTMKYIHWARDARAALAEQAAAPALAGLNKARGEAGAEVMPMKKRK